MKAASFEAAFFVFYPILTVTDVIIQLLNV